MGNILVCKIYRICVFETNPNSMTSLNFYEIQCTSISNCIKKKLPDVIGIIAKCLIPKFLHLVMNQAG